MKITKRILAFLLAALLCMTALYGCGENKDEAQMDDKGAVVNMFLTYLPADLDPGKAYFDSSVMQYFGLIFEGLTTYDKNGKLEKVLAKNWEYAIDERDNQLKLNIELNKNYWSDGVPVDADDFVYAWKRLLLPETVNPAASLLFPIKNASKVKSGELTIDDVGIRSVGDYELEIEFEEWFTDVEYFLEATASPALLPLREDIVTKGDEWAQSSATLVSNGPFCVREWDEKLMVIERNSFYKGLNLNPNNKPWKYVTPHRIVINCSVKNEDQLAEYVAGNNFYVGEFSQSAYAKNAKKIETTEELSTYTLLFNQNNPILADATTRKALSLALDRTELANIVGKSVKPATGFVPSGVVDCHTGKDFRKKAGKLISVSDGLSEAKALLSENKNFKGGKITIKYLRHDNGDTWEKDVARYVRDVWQELGLSVDVQPVKAKLFNASLDTGDFDVIAMDWQALTKDAYSFVMPFGTKTSGNAISVETEEIEYTPYVNGFSDAEYDKITENILVAKNTKERASLLYEAEKYLLDNAVVAPLFFNTDCYIASKKLSGIKLNLFAQKDLTGMKLKDYQKYLPVED